VDSILNDFKIQVSWELFGIEKIIWDNHGFKNFCIKILNNL